MPFLLALIIELLSIADSQIVKHGFLSSKELEVATSQQICRILSILIVQKFTLALYISSRIFPMASYCFFVLLKHVKHGFLFPEKLIPPTLS